MWQSIATTARRGPGTGWSTVPPTGGRAMSLTVQTEQRGDLVVISIVGELDMASAPHLQAQITELLDNGQSRFIFDLTDVSFCDSTGLSVFVRAKNASDSTGGVVRL